MEKRCPGNTEATMQLCCYEGPLMYFVGGGKEVVIGRSED